MKERPILFSAPMVRAILDGSKTQTRRIVKTDLVIDRIDTTLSWAKRLAETAAKYGQPLSDEQVQRNADKMLGKFFPVHTDDGMRAFMCPYGNVGDRLWVRESFFIPDAPYAEQQRDLISYKADETHPTALKYTGWRPSIHMPRWASRITLEITNVRVERLHDISGEDAKAEGVEKGWFGDLSMMPDSMTSKGVFPNECHRYGFGVLWDKINGKTAPWESNPWVWAVEFRRIDG